MSPDDVKTRDDLVAFAQNLSREYGRRGQDWENADLGRYLEAFGAWTNDMDGWFLNRGEQAPAEPSWSLIASMLLAATEYE